ncbi:hypothetical protein BH11ARM1_BH11ARM1_06170 [soil metagenome]
MKQVEVHIETDTQSKKQTPRASAKAQIAVSGSDRSAMVQSAADRVLKKFEGALRNLAK